MGEPLVADGITSANGWVTQRLGGFPKVGDVLPVGDYELRVQEMDGVRVARLRLNAGQSGRRPCSELTRRGRLDKKSVEKSDCPN